MSDDLNKTQKLTTLPPPEEQSPRSSNRPWEDEESSTRTTDSAIVVAMPSNPALQGTRAVLTVVSGPSTGQVFTVAEGGDPTVIGRGKEAQVRIDDAGASREHARFLETPDGSYVVEDMGSTNGTFVNSEQITQAVRLGKGDLLQIGSTVFEVSR